jgi:hypothetical protein
MTASGRILLLITLVAGCGRREVTLPADTTLPR